MADRIRIQTEQMQEISSQMTRLSSALRDIESRIRGLHIDRESGSEVEVRLPSGKLSSVECSLRSGEAAECLRKLSGVVNEMSRYTHAVAGSIGMAADAFDDTERMLTARFGALMGGEGSLFAGVCGVLGYDSDRSKWTSEMHDRFHSLISKGQLIIDGSMAMLIYGGVNYLFAGGGLIATFEETSGLSGVKRTAKLQAGHSLLEAQMEAGILSVGAQTKFTPLKKKKISEDSVTIDEDGNVVSGEEKKKLGQKLDILSIGASGSVSASAWHESGMYVGEHGSAEGSVDILTAEVHGSVKGGLGVYLPGKDGKSELYLGVDAEMGASVSAIDIKGSAEYELCDAVELSASGDVSVMTAGAYAAGGLGIVGGELVAYAKAGAEANLVEVNGEVGVDIGGVKGTVGAGVQVGVGASAEAGYKDGKITLDASVSLGVGVSINVELDIGGAIDNVGNAIQSFADGLSSISAWWG